DLIGHVLLVAARKEADEQADDGIDRLPAEGRQPVDQRDLATERGRFERCRGAGRAGADDADIDRQFPRAGILGTADHLGLGAHEFRIDGHACPSPRFVYSWPNSRGWRNEQPRWMKRRANLARRPRWQSASPPRSSRRRARSRASSSYARRMAPTRCPRARSRRNTARSRPG